jgi:hypothetical protein
MADPSEPNDLEDPEAALRKARDLVIASFDEICVSARRAVDAGAEALTTARNRVHRLAGLAGVVGFPEVSERALDLEAILEDRRPTAEAVQSAIDRLRLAFTQDLARPAPPWC